MKKYLIIFVYFILIYASIDASMYFLGYSEVRAYGSMIIALLTGMSVVYIEREK